MLGVMIFHSPLKPDSSKKLTKEGLKMKLPRYDKSAYVGEVTELIHQCGQRLKVVLFEGWMLGFRPLPTEVVQAVDPQLETVNKNLEAYYDAWDKFINAWIVIKIQDPSCVYQWRLQRLPWEAGKPGMTDEEVEDFVSRYLPAYKAYLPTLYAEGPSGSDPENVLLIEIDEGRNPILGNRPPACEGLVILAMESARVSTVEEPAIGYKRKGRAKSCEPTRAREELGDLETRLVNVELHLVDGEERFEELENRMAELAEGVEDFHKMMQRILNASIDKQAGESEALRQAHAEEFAAAKEENRVLREELDRVLGDERCEG
ncbi:hypothetical protein GH714_022660 [Hevea brasiliensis]|uniref:Uncharacterized protein n=1 Tax=Hevea brasiliensis TaxID=3981 RepID=A0A6A6LM22_HEVBR|nr:hypothetical protein GH714_022660 [Hevea brasiliensis]